MSSQISVYMPAIPLEIAQGHSVSYSIPPMAILVAEYDPTWPAHFSRIAGHLHAYLFEASVPVVTIEHVGSTSIPNLAAKPNIDIVILVPDARSAEAAKEALTWLPSPTEHYKPIGDGGIKGRISMKYHNRQAMPYRSVYIIHEQDEDGMLALRGHRDLKKVLMAESKETEDLRRQYADVKWEMVREGVVCGVDYGRRKNAIIRKILKQAGWTDVEVDKKEALDMRTVWEKEDVY